MARSIAAHTTRVSGWGSRPGLVTGGAVLRAAQGDHVLRAASRRRRRSRRSTGATACSRLGIGSAIAARGGSRALAVRPRGRAGHLPRGAAEAVKRGHVNVVVLTTSYPRDADDVAGVFVRDGVEALRAAGHRRDGRLARDVPPLRDRLRRRHRQQPPPASMARLRAPAVPPLLHAGCAARGERRRRRPCPLAAVGDPGARDRGGRSCSSSGARTSRSRAVLGGSARVARASCRLVVCASRALAEDARVLGARDVRVVPSGVACRRRCRRRTSLRMSSSSVGCRRRRACVSSPRPRASCRSSSSVTGRSGRCSRSGPDSSRRRSSATGTGARRSSSCRRGARDTASRPARRWRTGARRRDRRRRAPRRGAGRRDRAASCGRVSRARSVRRSLRAAGDPELRSRLGGARARLRRGDTSAGRPSCAALVDAYESAWAGSLRIADALDARPASLSGDEATIGAGLWCVAPDEAPRHRRRGIRRRERLRRRSRRASPTWEIVAFDNLHRRGSELNVPRLRASGRPLRARRRPRSARTCSAWAGSSGDRGLRRAVGARGRPAASTISCETNLVGAFNCLELCRRDDAHLVFLSTSRVYPMAALRAVAYSRDRDAVRARRRRSRSRACRRAGSRETFPLEGRRTLYGATKLAAELLIAEYAETFGLRTTVDRCGVIAGPVADGEGRPGRLRPLGARAPLRQAARLHRLRGQRQTGARRPPRRRPRRNSLAEQLDDPERWRGAVVQRRRRARAARSRSSSSRSSAARSRGRPSMWRPTRRSGRTTCQSTSPIAPPCSPTPTGVRADIPRAVLEDIVDLGGAHEAELRSALG